MTRNRVPGSSMGTAELNISSRELTIHSWLITYGSYTTPELTAQMREEIEEMWNEPKAALQFDGNTWSVRFRIDAYMKQDIEPEEILSNTDPRNNYIRVEDYCESNISFVDGLGCNTGYWLLENLYKGSTTAAHEYGHTLGLAHPSDSDYRGKGAPGIMYARGTLVDPPYQYEPDKPAGAKGGTMHPMHRRVRQLDIEMLNLHRLRYENNMAVVGEFTSIWHAPHVR